MFVAVSASTIKIPCCKVVRTLPAFVGVSVKLCGVELSVSVHVITIDGKTEDVVAVCVTIIYPLILYNPEAVTAKRVVAEMSAACATASAPGKEVGKEPAGT